MSASHTNRESFWGFLIQMRIEIKNILLQIGKVFAFFIFMVKTDKCSQLGLTYAGKTNLKSEQVHIGVNDPVPGMTGNCP